LPDDSPGKKGEIMENRIKAPPAIITGRRLP